MCYAVYIGTSIKQNVGTYIPDQTDLYLNLLRSEEEMVGLKQKFIKQHLYYVGSCEGCSCGFSYDPTDPNVCSNYDHEEESRTIKSLQALINLIYELTQKDDLEFYCCWEGDWEFPIEENIEIDIRQISLGKNYFGLTERQFILFKKQI